MESIFENEWAITKELLYETVPFRRKRKKALYIGIVLMSIYCFAAGFYFWTYRGMDAMTVFYLCVGCLALIMAIINPYIEINRTLNLIKKTYGMIPICKISFFEDGYKYLESTSNSNVDLSYSYDMIKEIKETSNFYALCMERDHCVFAKKDSFTKGDKEEFVRFIKGVMSKEKPL